MSATPNAMDGERVLVLVPHPDDEVVGAATALTELIAKGGQAFAAYLTTGVPPRAARWFGTRSTYLRAVKTRWQEATQVRDQIGLRCALQGGIPSRSLKSNLAATLVELERIARDLDIDRVWTPAYEGGHQDHDAANFLASQLAASHTKSLRVFEFAEYNFSDGISRSQTFPAQQLLSPENEIRIVLDAEAQSHKKRLLSLYASERRNLGGVEFNYESFRPLAAYDYTHPPHSEPLFYQRFHWVPYHPRIDYCRPDEVCTAFSEFVKSKTGASAVQKS